jgi:hypothetical protein
MHALSELTSSLPGSQWLYATSQGSFLARIHSQAISGDHPIDCC